MQKEKEKKEQIESKRGGVTNTLKKRRRK